jgi:predicted DCC family thiol-disulfide oxidoreductase YuxK
MIDPNSSGKEAATPGTVFYDGACCFCRASLRRMGGPFRRAGFKFVPYQQAVTAGTPAMPPAEFEREMKLLRADGRWFGGADAWIEMCLHVGWLKPFGWLGRVPGILQVLRWGYRRIAANRQCLVGQCRIDQETRS